MSFLDVLSLGTGAIVIAWVACTSFVRHRRRKRLLAKYQDEQIVDSIMSRKVWMGMTQEQLIDSWGRPVAKDHKAFKNKVVEVFKYDQSGKNRFRQRVQLENGLVVGWEQK